MYKSDVNASNGCEENDRYSGPLEVPLLHLGCTIKRSLLVTICDLGRATEGIPYSES